MIDEISNCTICTEKYDDKLRLPVTNILCGHTLCDQCYKKLSKKSCPQCGREIKNTTKNFEILNAIEKINLLKKEKELENYREKCSYHPLEISFSYCIDCSKFLCFDCLNNGIHFNTHVVKTFDNDRKTVKFFRQYRSKGSRIKEDFNNKIRANRDKFLETFISKTHSFIDNEIKKINSQFNEIFQRLWNEQNNLIDSLKELKSRILSFRNPFYKIEEDLFKNCVIENSSPYISTLLIEDTKEKDRISFYEYTSNDENKFKLKSFFEEINSINGDKNILLIVSKLFDDTFNKILNTIDQIKIDSQKLISSAISINKISVNEIYNKYNEKTYFEIMNSSIRLISQKLVFLAQI